MKVQLIRITPEAEALIAAAYGTCTNKIVVPENSQKWVKLGHESPLEHAVATFHISGISRACLAQLTRHRLASFSVQSMRYVEAAEEVVVPASISDLPVEDGISERASFLGIAKAVLYYYEVLVDAGVPKEDARFVLPLATTTNLIMTANFREWRHILKLRTHKSAQWEIRDLANKILDILVEQAPTVFEDLKNV